MRPTASFVFLLLLSLGTGCQPNDPAQSSLIVPPAEQCEAAGGSVELTGLTRSPRCVVPTADAGQVCSDSSDCEGRCLLEDWEGERPPRLGTRATGVCEASNLTYGCFAEVRRGRIASTFLCVD